MGEGGINRGVSLTRKKDSCSDQDKTAPSVSKAHDHVCPDPELRAKAIRRATRDWAWWWVAKGERGLGVETLRRWDKKGNARERGTLGEKERGKKKGRRA